MLLRQLQYFCSVARNESFTRAAEECYVSQSAISQQIKGLEAELGIELLDRSGRGAVLTPAGEHFALRAQDILDDVERAKYEAMQIAHGESLSLAVGYLNRFVGPELELALAEFARRHPRVRVTTHPGSHDELGRGVQDGTFDVVLSDRRRSLNDTAVNARMAERPVFVELSRAHALASEPQLSVGQLGRTPCILTCQPEHDDIERTYFYDVLNFRSPFLFARSSEEARMRVASNQGFRLVDGGRDVSAGAGGVVRVPFVSDQGAAVNEYFCFYGKEHATALVEEFVEVLKVQFAEE